MSKILCLIDGLESGGAERQMLNLAVGLKKNGHEIKLMTFYDTIFYLKELDNAGISVLYNALSKYKCLRFFILWWVIRTFNPAMVVVYKDGACMVACVTRIFKTFHLVVSERNTTQLLSWKTRLKFLLYRRADWIVPNSFSQAAYIKEHYPNLYRKIKVITNVVDVTRFKPTYGRQSVKTPHIVTVAKFMRQKNYLAFCEAIKIIADKGIKVHFDWYGSFKFDKDYFDEVQERIGVLGIKDYITIYEPTFDVELVYQQSYAFCLPSIYEGFPNALCEAMSCGLPVACSNVCDNSIIMKDKKNGFIFDPHDVRDIADKLQCLVSISDEERELMSIANRERILNLCSESFFVGKYMDLM